MAKRQVSEVRRSARLKAVSQLEGGTREKQLETGASPTGEDMRHQAQHSTSYKPSLKRKRDQEALNLSIPEQNPLPSNRSRTSAQQIEKHTNKPIIDPVQSWILNETWPPEYFEADDQGQEELCEHDSWLEDIMAQPPIPVIQHVEANGFRIPLPVKRVPASLRRKQSDSSLSGSSEKNREKKSSPYRQPGYTTLLGTKGSFLRDFDNNIPQTMSDICDCLLTRDQILPQNSLFRDDLFHKLFWKIQERNEAMIIQDVTRLIVPSAMNLAIYGDTHLDNLMESVNEAWICSIPVVGPRPQPDYAVGFAKSAFTNKQQKVLEMLIGSIPDSSYFASTDRMYFPFLTCEVKCGAVALDIANRQNAHSMTIAVRGVVELYRAVNREKELDREILAFSISHDYHMVHIYGHYPVINGDQVTFYRHNLHEFSIAALGGKEKWTAYKFTKNVYDIWMPTHLKRISSAIDQLPSSLDFQISDELGVQVEEATSLLQNTGSLLPDPDNISLASHADELNPIPQIATPDTSVSKGVDQGAAKRPKKSRITKEPSNK